MTYWGMSFIHARLSSFVPINVARHDPLLIVMRLAPAVRCDQYGYYPCGSQVCISMQRLHHFFHFTNLEQPICSSGSRAVYISCNLLRRLYTNVNIVFSIVP